MTAGNARYCKLRDRPSKPVRDTISLLIKTSGGISWTGRSQDLPGNECVVSPFAVFRVLSILTYLLLILMMLFWTAIKSGFYLKISTT